RAQNADWPPDPAEGGLLYELPPGIGAMHRPLRAGPRRDGAASSREVRMATTTQREWDSIITLKHGSTARADERLRAEVEAAGYAFEVDVDGGYVLDGDHLETRDEVRNFLAIAGPDPEGDGNRQPALPRLPGESNNAPRAGRGRRKGS